MMNDLIVLLVYYPWILEKVCRLKPMWSRVRARVLEGGV